MRILLHVGMPKAGSTALQRAFAAGRDTLARNGVLYPRAPHFSDSQNFLVAGVEDRPHALPRMLRAAYEGRTDRIAPDFARWMAGIRSSVAAARPETLLLSSEWLFGLRGPGRFAALGDLLRPLAERIEVVAYVRQPSDQYLSTVQQTLKGSHAIRRPAAVSYRTPLEGFARFADRLHVVRYARADFPGGDIVGHFVAAYLPARAGIALPAADLSANSSLSAESMSILARYRRVNHRDRRGRFTPDTERLIDALRGAEAAAGGVDRPRLRPEIREAIDGASEDVLWLREAHGIVFDGIDYGRVARAAATEDDARRPRRIEQICVVDRRRRNKILMRALHALASAGAAPAAVSWRRIRSWRTARGGPAKR